MNSQIFKLGNETVELLRGLSLEKDARELRDAVDELKTAINALKDLRWDDLFAVKDEERQELTACQQKVHECYAKLKRALLVTYKEIFTAVKEL